MAVSMGVTPAISVSDIVGDLYVVVCVIVALILTNEVFLEFNFECSNRSTFLNFLW